MVNQKNWNLRIATRASKSHRTGYAYSAIQNTFESVALTCRCGLKSVLSTPKSTRNTRGIDTSADSKTQTDSPSGPVSFHQRNPHSSRPETFFTVQKSKAKRRTIMTKSRTLLSAIFPGGRGYKSPVNMRPNKYDAKAATQSQNVHPVVLLTGRVGYQFGRRGRRRGRRGVPKS